MAGWLPAWLAGWLRLPEHQVQKKYFAELVAKVSSERAAGKTIYPPSPDVFAAFNYTPFADVKVVILGQDPYHGPSQAHGLCFSVQHGVAPPPSLKNMYKELATTVPGFTPPNHGNLEAWARQGVFLLNASLTVRRGEPNSHAKLGWQVFTDAVIEKISREREKVVFMLWGATPRPPLVRCWCRLCRFWCWYLGWFRMRGQENTTTTTTTTAATQFVGGTDSAAGRLMYVVSVSGPGAV